MFAHVHNVCTQHQYNCMQSVISLEQHRLTSIYLENIHLLPMDSSQNLPGANFKSKYQELHGEGRLPTVYLGKAAPGAGEWEMKLGVIKEKIASDLYYYLGQGAFHIPESYLSYQLLNDPYTAPRIASFPGIDYPLRSVRIMSRWMHDFNPLGSMRTMEGVQERGVMEFIRDNHIPPETIRIPENEWGMIPVTEWTSYRRDVPIYGLMTLLAVGRVLADTDVVGYDGGNVGIVWERDSQNRIIAAKAVKIDPGQSFNFAERRERDLTIYPRGQGVEGRDINLDRLSENQRNEFRFALHKSLHLLSQEGSLHYLFFRCGRLVTGDVTEIQNLIEQLRRWRDVLRDFYQDLLS